MNSIVSIITPYRNAAKYLPRFVSSIIAQSLTEWICIMVDDGSTDDGPLQLDRTVGNDPRFILIKNTLKKMCPSPASARNCGLSQVTTPLVAFCDVDDMWHPLKLERQVSFHLDNHLDLSVSAYGRFLDNKPSYPIYSFICPPSELNLTKLRGRNPIPMLTVLISTQLARIGFSQVSHEDFLFWLQLFRAHPSLRYGCLREVLAYYCVHPDSTSGKKSKVPIWVFNVYRRFGLSTCSSLWLMLFWLKDHLLARVALLLATRHKQYYVQSLLKQQPLVHK